MMIMVLMMIPTMNIEYIYDDGDEDEEPDEDDPEEEAEEEGVQVETDDGVSAEME